MSYFRARVASDEGATMVEYGIMVALIAVVSVLVVGALGLDVFGAFDSAQDKLPLQRTVQVRLGTNILRLIGGTAMFTVSRHRSNEYLGRV